MKRLLLCLLPVFLPVVVAWARRREAFVLEHGFPLDEEGRRDAEAAGVRCPEAVRIMLVDVISFPGHPLLEFAAWIPGIHPPSTRGLCLRYGILVRRDCFPERSLVAHECVHTAQYERLGGLKPFLRQYLRECISTGYPQAPLEEEAIRRASEIVCRT